MQSLNWYYHRLRTMSAGEIAWRVRSLARDKTDRFRFALGLIPKADKTLREGRKKDYRPGFRVCDLDPGEWQQRQAGDNEKTWAAALIQRAEPLLQNRLTFFNLKEHFLGNPINWNKDHESGRKAPLSFSGSIDYRDFKEVGDCKLVWEPNRHHQMVVLGRAYRATGDFRYAAAVVEQITSWLDQCPFGRGMNWRSPLELGIRLINWVWAIDLIRESGLFEGEFRRRLIHSVYLHLWEITRKYSRGSSANNHLIGEAAGVFIATSYFHWFPYADIWRRVSKEILTREIIEQTHPDGCTREQAMGYQLFVVQFFLVCGVVARKAENDFTEEYWARLEKMLEFVGYLSEGGPLPMFGDNDDGYVLDLGETPRDPRDLLASGAVIFKRADFKTWAGGYREFTRWLMGKESRGSFVLIPVPSQGSVESRAFTDSGYYLLQSGHRNTLDRISVLFDCGELGFGSLAAHGHADALSFILRAFGEDIFVDPGTYDYFSFPRWRNYFRGTGAHNTISIDNLDQSVMLGPFLWGRQAKSRCIEWETHKDGGSVIGEHDGYENLIDPVIHRRTLILNARERVLIIQDDIFAKKMHSVSICFHLNKDCMVSQTESNQFRIETPGGILGLAIDSRLNSRIIKNNENPFGGWLSGSYHKKSESISIIGQFNIEGNIQLKNLIQIGSVL